MESIKNPTILAEVYPALTEEFSNYGNDDILFSHTGYFDRTTIYEFSTKIESILTFRGESSQLVRKIFAIVVEGLENIITHGKEDGEGRKVGHLWMKKGEEKYNLSFGNKVNKANKNYVERYLNQLNKMNYGEISQLYLSSLTNSINTGKAEIGLGFITIILKSRSKINFQMIELNENDYYFERRVSVN